MLELIEIELTRVRKMAEQAGDDFLLYLIDLAIIEANAKARSRRERTERERTETVDPVVLTGNEHAISPKAAPNVQAAR